jgi:TPR repeat protein
MARSAKPSEQGKQKNNMLQYSNLNREMETRDHSKNEAILKSSIMSTGIFLRKVCFSLLAASIVFLSACQGYRERKEAERRTEENRQIFEQVSKRAEQGYAEAQFDLGFCYFDGEIISQNYTQAVNWFRKSAKQGYSRAQMYLGFCYYYGNGVTKDGNNALYWFYRAERNIDGSLTKHEAAELSEVKNEIRDEGYSMARSGDCSNAAEQGDGLAQMILAAWYETNREYDNAIYWYERAIKNEDRSLKESAITYIKQVIREIISEHGDAKRQFELGRNYYKALDYAEAVFWFRKAAEQGHAHSQLNLGFAYKNGEGVVQDNRMAGYWFRRAQKDEDGTLGNSGLNASDIELLLW